MAASKRPSFLKRQKEQARATRALEKREAKRAKREAKRAATEERATQGPPERAPEDGGGENGDAAD